MTNTVEEAHYERFREGGYLLSTDQSKLDIAAIHHWLSVESYWAQGRTLEVLERAIANSICFGVYLDGKQVAVARVITDYATFAWVCDVFVDSTVRGDGIGKWMVESIVAHPNLKGLKRMLLATRDAHELYRRYGGFEPLANPGNWLIRLSA